VEENKGGFGRLPAQRDGNKSAPLLRGPLPERGAAIEAPFNRLMSRAIKTEELDMTITFMSQATVVALFRDRRFLDKSLLPDPEARYPFCDPPQPVPPEATRWSSAAA